MTVDPTFVAFTSLTAAERQDLLRLARATIHRALDSHTAAAHIALTAQLVEPGAAFVSLHCEGRLRGCVGTVTADSPLHETVAHMARCAAFDDPRFPPMSTAEVPIVEIEISRLSGMVPAAPEDVRPGLHGVCVSRDQRRAVFLPQVATTFNWDRDTLLDELCRKALLPADAWRQPGCTLMVFVAEVFGECAADR